MRITSRIASTALIVSTGIAALSIAVSVSGQPAPPPPLAAAPPPAAQTL